MNSKLILIAAMALGCLLSIPAAAQEQTAASITAMCTTEMSKQDSMGMNVPGYCSCIGERLNRHTGKLEHNDGERVRKQVMNDLTPCFDQHMKTKVMELCSGFNTKLAAEKQKAKLDCNCYYNGMVDNFSASWAANLTNQSITPEQQTAMAQQSLAKCAREMP